MLRMDNKLKETERKDLIPFKWKCPKCYTKIITLLTEEEIKILNSDRIEDFPGLNCSSCGLDVKNLTKEKKINKKKRINSIKSEMEFLIRDKRLCEKICQGCLIFCFVIPISFIFLSFYLIYFKSFSIPIIVGCSFLGGIVCLIIPVFEFYGEKNEIEDINNELKEKKEKLNLLMGGENGRTRTSRI